MSIGNAAGRVIALVSSDRLGQVINCRHARPEDIAAAGTSHEIFLARCGGFIYYSSNERDDIEMFALQVYMAAAAQRPRSEVLPCVPLALLEPAAPIQGVRFAAARKGQGLASQQGGERVHTERRHGTHVSMNHLDAFVSAALHNRQLAGAVFGRRRDASRAQRVASVVVSVEPDALHSALDDIHNSIRTNAPLGNLIARVNRDEHRARSNAAAIEPGPECSHRAGGSAVAGGDAHIPPAAEWIRLRSAQMDQQPFRNKRHISQIQRRKFGAAERARKTEYEHSAVAKPHRRLGVQRATHPPQLLNRERAFLARRFTPQASRAVEKFAHLGATWR